MKSMRLALSALAVALVCSASAFAQVPAGAPAGTTGMCNDGTYSNAASKSGACRGHKGVKAWYAPVTAKPAPAQPAASVAAKPAPPASAAPPPAASKPGLFSNLTAKPAATATAPTPAPAPKPAPAGASTAAPAAGGGPGMVWVNTSTKVYHCPTDRYYGKTKSGSYMTEAAALAAGDKPDAGKKCF
jgi:hypothetical protein